MGKNIRPIALQSKKWLSESFFSLLAKKTYSNIFISEISQNAGLDRRTFYRHFKSKEDIIKDYFYEASEEYGVVMSRYVEAGNITGQYPDFSNKSISEMFFVICENNKTVLTLLYKQNLLYLMLPELDVIFAKYRQMFASKEELDLSNGEYHLGYHIGGLFNLLTKWLNENCQRTPRQMGEIVDEILSFNQI